MSLCVECGRPIKRRKDGYSHVKEQRHIARPFKYAPVVVPTFAPFEPPAPGWVRWLLRRLTT